VPPALPCYAQSFDDDLHSPRSPILFPPSLIIFFFSRRPDLPPPAGRKLKKEMELGDSWNMDGTSNSRLLPSFPARQLRDRSTFEATQVLCAIHASVLSQSFDDDFHSPRSPILFPPSLIIFFFSRRPDLPPLARRNL